MLMACARMIAADEIAQLWWRLLHSQMPKVNQPKAVVLLIGTNDLTIDDCAATEMGTIAAVPGIVSRYARALADAALHCSCVPFVVIGNPIVKVQS